MVADHGPQDVPCTNHHFINHTEDVEATIGGRRCVEEEMIHTYIYDRACVFFSALCETSEAKAQSIDPAHFINKALLKFFKPQMKFTAM